MAGKPGREGDGFHGRGVGRVRDQRGKTVKEDRKTALRQLTEQHDPQTVN